MWFFKRKKKEPELSVINIPLPVLIRQVVYDSAFESTEEIANLIGLPPISEEVHEMEERASDLRLQRFVSLMPIIDTHADISAEIASFAYVIESKREDGSFSIDEEALSELKKLFKIISISSAVSCISSLMDLRLLHTEVIPND